jgi:hypothetical protein
MAVIRRILAAASVAALLAVAPPARAMGVVVTSPAGASATVSLRVAVAGATGRTARWGSVEVRGSATEFAWIIPVRNGAFLDLASDAFFEALGTATSPRVVPPQATPPCGIAGGVEVAGDFTHTVTAAPGAAAVAADRPTLEAELAAWGLALTSDVVPALDAALASGQVLVALRFASPAAQVVTRTVRVVDDGAETLPLSLVTSGAAPVDVTAYAFERGAASLAAGTAVALDPSTVLWNRDGTSTYGSARDALLGANPRAWLFETAGPDVVFDGAEVPGAAATPAFASAYFSLAAAYGDASGSPGRCAQDAASWASASSSVAAACPAGALARVGLSTCIESVAQGEIAPDPFRCGGISEDAAIALSGLSPGSTWITRMLTRIAPDSTGADGDVVPGQYVTPYGPVVTATTYSTGCPSPPSSGVISTTASAGPSNDNGAGGSSGGSPSSDPGNDPTASTVVATAAGASDVASAASEGCDSGGSSDGSGDSCSSSSSGSGDPGSSDSESSSSGCSGSSSSPSDSSSNSCQTGRSRRSPTSRVGLLAVAASALARRRRRPGPGT